MSYRVHANRIGVIEVGVEVKEDIRLGRVGVGRNRPSEQVKKRKCEKRKSKQASKQASERSSTYPEGMKAIGFEKQSL